jgi:hypothetical protein
MTALDRLSWRGIRWLLFDTLEVRQRTSATVVLKAMPLAFPVLETTHVVRERVPEKLGLVRRYVLEGLVRFGPANAEALDALLGLGPERIQQTLLDLERGGAGMTRQDRAFRAGPEAQQLLQGGAFARIVAHRRKFLVNGLTDELLPIDFWRTHEGCALSLDPDRPGGPVCDEAGNPTGVLVKVADRGVDGAAALHRWLASAAGVDRERLGVPPGAFEFTPEPLSRQAAWVLAFLLVAADGARDIVSAGRGSVRLVDERTSSAEYLGLVCRNLEPESLQPRVDFERLQERLSGWPAGTRLRQAGRPGEVLVSVPTPEKTLPPPWLLGEEDAAENRRATAALVGGLYWEVGLWAVLRLAPGDRATATRVGLLRGVQALRTALRGIDASIAELRQFDFPAWWSRWQAEYAATLPAEAVPAPIAAGDLLDAADNFPDTEFLETLDPLRGGS